MIQTFEQQKLLKKFLNSRRFKAVELKKVDRHLKLKATVSIAEKCSTSQNEFGLQWEKV